MEITSALFSDLLPAALQQKQTSQGYTPDYYSQVQDYYAGYLPGQETDTQALKNWYGSSMAGGTAGSSIPYGGIGVAPSANTINQLAPLFQGLAATNAAGSTGGDSYTTSLTPTQEAFFNFLDSPEGQSYKDARGAALSNVIGAGLGLFGPGLIGPAASLYNYMTDKPNISDAVKALIAADQAGFQAAQDALTNYGSTSTAMGPTTAEQAQALADAFSSQLSSSSDSGGYTSDQGGGGWGGNDSGYADGVGGVY